MAVSPSRALRRRCAGSRARLSSELARQGAARPAARWTIAASAPWMLMSRSRSAGLENLEALRDGCAAGQAGRSIDQPVAVADRRAVADALRIAPVAGLDVAGEVLGIDLPAARPAHMRRAAQALVFRIRAVEQLEHRDAFGQVLGERLRIGRRPPRRRRPGVRPPS